MVNYLKGHPVVLLCILKTEYKIIQVLHIDPDLIFYPRKPTKDSEVEDLLRMLYNCDERSLEVVKATAKALIGTTLEK